MDGWTLHEIFHTFICNVANNKLNPLTAKFVDTECAVIPGCVQKNEKHKASVPNMIKRKSNFLHSNATSWMQIYVQHKIDLSVYQIKLNQSIGRERIKIRSALPVHRQGKGWDYNICILIWL